LPQFCGYRVVPRENELREPIPHIGLCTYHELRSSIFKRNVIGQIIKILKTQKHKMAQSVGEEVHLAFVDEDDDLVLAKCGKHNGIGISNMFLKIIIF